MKKKHYLASLMVTVVILLIPLIAMQVSDGWNWGVGDFLTMGALLFGTSCVFQIFVRRAKTPRERVLAGALVIIVFLLIWIQLAVGIF